MEDKLIELLKFIVEMESPPKHYDLINALDTSFLFNDDEEKNQAIDFAIAKKVLEFKELDNDPHSTPRYIITNVGYKFYEQKSKAKLSSGCYTFADVKKNEELIQLAKEAANTILGGDELRVVKDMNIVFNQDTGIVPQSQKLESEKTKYLSLSDNEKLNKILGYLASDFGKGGVDFDLLVKKFSGTVVQDGNEMVEILKKLIKDEYIEKEEYVTTEHKVLYEVGKRVTKTCYKILFDARAFLKNGGYLEERLKDTPISQSINPFRRKIKNIWEWVNNNQVVSAIIATIIAAGICGLLKYYRVFPFY
jgi:hypothetical protein